MTTPSPNDEPRARSGVRALAALLFGIGLVSRLVPFRDQGGRLLRQFPTEDGYLMLTMARNLGIGNGMSIADGTIPTNGTQPLATMLWSVVFALVDGDKRAGVAGVLALEVVISLAAAGMLFLLARRVLAGVREGTAVALLASSAWFASAQTARHAMNCLETGLAVLVVTTFFWALLRLAEDAPARPALGRWAALGALLGVSFWARIDAVLLCVALGVAHLAGWLPIWRSGFRDRFLELGAAGTATAVIASPWLVHNLVRFGSIMPVSGQSEGFRVALGRELPYVPAKLVEYLSVILQLPSRLETHPAFISAAVAALGLAGYALARRFPGWSAPARSLATLGLLLGAGLVLWYGLVFGAGHFMSRYLFPLSPLLAILTTAAVFGCVHRRGQAALGWAAAAAVVVTVAGLNARLYAGGTDHAHFHVVAWVDEHVPENVWVGAIQTGTLGFFHDRTINLDGKVNPHAMEARRSHTIPAYVERSDIQYLADWKGITFWANHYPEIWENFEVLIAEDDPSFGVLMRHGAPRKERRTRADAAARP